MENTTVLPLIVISFIFLTHVIFSLLPRINKTSEKFKSTDLPELKELLEKVFSKRTKSFLIAIFGPIPCSVLAGLTSRFNMFWVFVVPGILFAIFGLSFGFYYDEISKLITREIENRE